MKQIASWPGFEPSPRYIYQKSRELEGTLAQGPKVGTWIITGHRVCKGWGLIPESAWPYYPHSSNGWPPEEPPSMDMLAKKIRTIVYQRIRDLKECKVALSRGYTFTTAVEITNQWFSATDGIIEMPSTNNPILRKSHAFFIYGYDNEKRIFKFQNSWGRKWGRDGCGSLPYAYFENYSLETWVANGFYKGPIKSKDKGKAGRWIFNRGLTDVFGSIVHIIEMYDVVRDEFVGWAFGVCREEFLDIEEIFIKPNFRDVGNGNYLAREVNNLSDHLGLSLRLWIPHVDVDKENFIKVKKILAHLSLRFEPSNVRWASCKAIS